MAEVLGHTEDGKMRLVGFDTDDFSCVTWEWLRSFDGVWVRGQNSWIVPREEWKDFAAKKLSEN